MTCVIVQNKVISNSQSLFSLLAAIDLNDVLCSSRKNVSHLNACVGMFTSS